MDLLKTGLVAAALLLASPANAQQSTAAPPAPAPAPGQWVRIDPMPVTVNGRLHTPTCSDAPGANPAFAFWFSQGSGDGLVVFFDGGGACWNDQLCSRPRLSGDRAVFTGTEAESVFKAELLPGDEPSRMGGIFDRSNPRNPVRDWSALFVSYCTGDVHAGSSSTTYRHPDTGAPFTIQHRGWDNMQVILQWMRTNVRQPARLLVAGSSAGAYGAAEHYASVRELYPAARAAFLGDAGQGVTTPEFERSRNANWNYQLPSSVFGPNPASTPDVELVARLAAHFPRDYFGQYTTTYDATQTGFLTQMGGPQTCGAWTERMTRELTRRQETPNFRAYRAQGDTHTILRSPLFFTEQSGGAPFAEWLGGLLNGQPQGNMICTNCGAPAQRCS